MQQHAGQNHQQSDVQGEDFVFLELCARVVGAVNGRHEVRVIEEQRERVERDGPRVGVRGRDPGGNEKKRSRPAAAADQQVEPRLVNPGGRGFRPRRGRRRDGFSVSAQRQTSIKVAYKGDEMSLLRERALREGHAAGVT